MVDRTVTITINVPEGFTNEQVYDLVCERLWPGNDMGMRDPIIRHIHGIEDATFIEGLN